MEQPQYIALDYVRSGLPFEGGGRKIIAADFTTHTCHCQCLTMQVQPHRMFTEQAEQYTGAVFGLINNYRPVGKS